MSFIRLALLIIIGVGLSACGEGSTAMGAADQLISSQLRSPSSYSVVSQKIVWTGNYKGRNSYVVRTEYDAQNGFGASIRDCKYVAFSLEGTQIKGKRNTMMLDCGSEPTMRQLGYTEESAIQMIVSQNFD